MLRCSRSALLLVSGHYLHPAMLRAPGGELKGADFLLLAQGPTAGQFLGFDTMQLNSLGDWQDKSSIPRDASMPLHYSAARYDLSLRTKHMLHIALGTLTAFESWEVIPEEEYRKAMSDARQGVDAVLKQEIRTLWTKPTNREELQARFQLSES